MSSDHRAHEIDQMKEKLQDGIKKNRREIVYNGVCLNKFTNRELAKEQGRESEKKEGPEPYIPEISGEEEDEVFEKKD